MDEDSGNTQSQMSKRAQSKQPQKQNSSPLVDVETGENSGNTESQISKRAKSKKSQKKNKLTPLPQVEDGSDIEMGDMENDNTTLLESSHPLPMDVLHGDFYLKHNTSKLVQKWFTHEKPSARRKDGGHKQGD